MLTTKYEPRYALRIAAMPLLKCSTSEGLPKTKVSGFFVRSLSFFVFRF